MHKFVMLTIIILTLPLITHAQPLDIRLGKIYRGENAGDYFSTGIGAAGDINGDGYNDYLIGARFYGDDNRGRAYIYLGGDTLPDEPALVLTGPGDEGVFGIYLNGIGDINVDGYDDYAIFSVGYYPQRGALRIYARGDTLSSSTMALLRGTVDEQLFGVSICIGDLNDDGYTDLVLGAPSGSAPSPPGKVFVYFGSDTIDFTPDWVTIGGYPGMRYGRNVATGDLNGDGIDDLVIGEVNVYDDTSGIHIFIGGSTFDTEVDVSITSSEYGYLGWYIIVGDITGDGADDLVNRDIASDSQKIYFGGADFDSIPDDVLYATGYISGSIGHVNLDGAEDLLLGNFNENAFRVYRGGYPFDHQPDYVYGEPFLTGFGYPVVLGDVNGDGAGDFLVAESHGGTPFQEEGQAYVFLGDTTPVVSIQPEPELLPRKSVLLWAYPNPFNAGTEIFYTIQETDRVVLKVYNIKGEEVKTLIDSIQARGRHSAVLRSEGLGSGIYFARLETLNRTEVMKLLLIK